MIKILKISFFKTSSQKFMVAIVFLISIMLLPSTNLHILPLKIEAQTSINKPVNISNSTAISYLPVLAVSRDTSLVGNDSVYVAWTDDSERNGDIYFKRSADNGTTFGSTQNLSQNPGNSTAAQMAAYRDNVYVLWEDSSTGNGDIYFRKSTDRGINFGSIENLSNNTSISDSLDMAVSGGDVYAVWSDNSTGNGDIFLRKSIDNGTTFGTQENLSNDNGRSYGAQIIISGNSVYVVWNDGSTGNGDVYFKRSIDNGITFGSTQNLSPNLGNSTAAQMAAYRDNVYVLWEDSSTGNGDIYFKASLDNGTTFGGQKSLARNNGSSFNPQLAVSPNNIIYGMWQDDTQYDRSKNTTSDVRAVDVLYRVSLDSGRNFTTRNTIGGDIGDTADFAQIATAFNEASHGMSNDAYVVWTDILKYRQPYSYELFFQTITNNGTTLSEPTNLSNSDGNSTFPRIAVSDRNNVYVVWRDDPAGNGDVFFTRAN